MRPIIIVGFLALLIASACKSQSGSNDVKEVNQKATIVREYETQTVVDVSYWLVAQKRDDIKIERRNAYNKNNVIMRVRTKDAKPYQMKDNSYTENFKNFWSKAVARDSFVQFEVEAPQDWYVGMTFEELLVCELMASESETSLSEIVKARHHDYNFGQDSLWSSLLVRAVGWDGAVFVGEGAEFCQKHEPAVAEPIPAATQ